MDNGQKYALRHSDEDKTILAVVFSIIDPLDGKRIAEDLPRGFEIDAMLGVIFGCLRVVPFERVVPHQSTVYP